MTKEPSHKKKLGRICLALILGTSIGSCGCWAIAHVTIIFSQPYWAVLNGVFVVAYVGFAFCMFLKIIFSWMHIIINNNRSEHKILRWIVSHETLMIASLLTWVIFCIIASNLVMWRTQVYMWTYIGLCSVGILPIILSIGLLVSIRQLIELLQSLQSDEKRRKFRTQFMFITFVFLSMFDLLVLYDILHILYSREELVISDWFTIWIPQTITFSTMFWLFYPFKRNKTKTTSIILESRPAFASNIAV